MYNILFCPIWPQKSFSNAQKFLSLVPVSPSLSSPLGGAGLAAQRGIVRSLLAACLLPMDLLAHLDSYSMCLSCRCLFLLIIAGCCYSGIQPIPGFLMNLLSVFLDMPKGGPLSQWFDSGHRVCIGLWPGLLSDEQV